MFFGRANFLLCYVTGYNITSSPRLAEATAKRVGQDGVRTKKQVLISLLALCYSKRHAVS